LKSLLFLFLQNKCFVFIVIFCISSEAKKYRACFYLFNW
jgi:hypothetical protein